MCVEECLVVVKNLGRLGKRKCIHLVVTELLTFVVVTLDKVVDLLLCETESFCRTVLAGNCDIACNEGVKRDCCLCHVVKSNVVGVTVSDVGLSANSDLCLDLVTNVIVTAYLLMFNCNVGIDLVELFYITIENVTKILSHGVIECDCNGGACVKAFFGNHEICFAVVCLSARSHSKHIEAERQKKDDCYNNLFHGKIPFFI